MPKKDSIFAEERKQKILDLVNRQSKATVSELCALYDVSPATVRNDLRDLENAGLLKRTHGGALSNAMNVFDQPYRERLVERGDEKAAIGREAAKLIEEGDRIVIDVGTTTRELAKSITGFKDLTIVTNDLFIANYLNENSNFDIFVPGGRLRKGFNTFYGQTSIDAIKNLNVNKAFLSTEGFTLEDGATNTNEDLTRMKAQYVKCADEAIILCDSHKFGKTAFMSYAEATEIDTIVTTEYFTNTRMIRDMEQSGIKVILAKV
ncbi:MAG: DeoR/GlpR transcriptional regulator [Clostridia bacterium]|jgi:DeoR family fructose operon transcriptional repressor|nr:DeoR/GlpR transcriptional regulator [Clostridia bacterium]MBQ5957151.1 DeoR/GlpR transcriptional regulator [Clostridia bacterium]MBR0439017.1 DeoR/GlpR transcriptional regulator [Clostridia bacterium]MBR3563500.1 DeoR/GlpR transcriptional regulator [Clostridia bacterium]MBR6823367.1 DeoR/GlpR transcriptional regulator [Clostridia bacterium]